MSNYRRGYRFEQRVRKHLEAEGWVVFRQGKSAFPDLICFKRLGGVHASIMLVECKVNRGQFSKSEVFRLVELADSIGLDCIGVLAHRKSGRIIFETLKKVK